MQVKLWDDVADTREIYLLVTEPIFYEFGNGGCLSYRHATQVIRQIEQIGDISFRNENKPREDGVLVQ